MTDLYMSRCDVSRDEMQLIGATAVLLASKFYVSSKSWIVWASHLKASYIFAFGIIVLDTKN